MKSYDLNKYLNDEELVKNKIDEFIDKKIIKKEKKTTDEIEGHIIKSENNLNFIKDNISLGYFDWAITGCYYACYHSALALILTKNYSSKNHLATLLLLIKEFYEKGLNKEDLDVLIKLLNYQDILFYVEAKNKREDATYSTNLKYNKKDVEKLRIKTTLFVSKIKKIINLERN
jgi:uncharacterized protein (UPF0332 family)